MKDFDQSKSYMLSEVIVMHIDVLGPGSNFGRHANSRTPELS